MKLSLCVVAVCLCVSLSLTVAQSLPPSCDADSEIGADVVKLSAALQASPSEQCKDQMLALVQVTDFHAQATTVFAALAVVCESTCLDYVRNFAENCRPSYVDVLGHACARNEHSLFCYQTVLMNNGTDVLMRCFPELFQPGPPVEMSQSPTPSNTTATPAPEPSCSNECQGSIQTFRMLHGCCVTNAFNSTTFGLLSLGLADYSLWRDCGLETIDGFCPLPFNVTPTVSEDVVVTTGTMEVNVTNTVAMTTLPSVLGTDSSLQFTAQPMLTLFSLVLVLLVLFL